MNQRLADHVDPQRFRVLIVIFGVVLLTIIFRLGYWQIVRASSLQVEAQSQYERLVINRGRRGNIKTSDGYTLVDTEQKYRVFLQPHHLTLSPDELGQQLSPLLLSAWHRQTNSTESASSALQNIRDLIALKATKESKWVSVLSGLSSEERVQLQSAGFEGVGTEPYFTREYPEGSLAAQVVGLVGKNDAGEDTGYFGIEGALDRELSGQFDTQILPQALPGLSLPTHLLSTRPQDGREITLTIRRDLQYLAETELRSGMERYGAKGGEVILMQPATGKILALATAPGYDPRVFSEYEAQLYKNPSITSGYEPGSTLKTLTVAAGIDAGVITPDTSCTNCDGPRQIAGYTLKTWNNQYSPGITMTEALAKSDNTAMIFAAELLGADRLKNYLQGFGLGVKTGVELQEDTSPPFPTRWGPVELATISFGQGISTTSMQVIKAINAIANQGMVMRPMIVEHVSDPISGESITSEPYIENTVITPETARLVTQMMVNAAQHGEAQWTVSNDHWIAAKTGTSQVPVDGGYSADRTIASFVGFAPPDNPQFIMLVKLIEPTTSPWAAETAAPLWYKIAKKVFILLGIPPDKVIPAQSTPEPILDSFQSETASPSAAISNT